MHRIDVDCDCYYKCGGCVFRHISYDEELRIKSKFIKDSLSKFAGINNFNISDIIGAKEINHYRNKAQVPVRYGSDEKIISGFLVHTVTMWLNFQNASCIIESLIG